MGTVCVEVAARDDPRLTDALDSLALQTRRPDRILIAASADSPPRYLANVRERFTNLPLRVLRFPGGVVAARAGAQPWIGEATTVFLDSDEVAPPEWLARLVAPVEAGTADFTGGPTRPRSPPTTSVERYMYLLESALYSDVAAGRLAYYPLQNTAWRTDALFQLGFDPRIPFAEDHDVETRARKAGLRGAYVPEAWVYHAPTGEASTYRWARKRYRYLVAMTMSLAKNGELGRRLAQRRRPVAHRLRYVEGMMKPLALLDGRGRWARVRDRPILAPSALPEPPG